MTRPVLAGGLFLDGRTTVYPSLRAVVESILSADYPDEGTDPEEALRMRRILAIGGAAMAQEILLQRAGLTMTDCPVELAKPKGGEPPTFWAGDVPLVIAAPDFDGVTRGNVLRVPWRSMRELLVALRELRVLDWVEL